MSLLIEFTDLFVTSRKQQNLKSVTSQHALGMPTLVEAAIMYEVGTP